MTKMNKSAGPCSELSPERAGTEGKRYQKSALESAADYLSHRMRTEAEVRNRLKDKDYETEEIDEAIDSLKSHRYIDDYEYALRYIEYGYGKHRGSRRILRELEEKGIDGSTAQNAYEDYCYENHVDEYAEALAIARSTVGEGFGESYAAGKATDSDPCIEIDDRTCAKVARKLESRGFRSEDIYKALAEMRKWKSEEQ